MKLVGNPVSRGIVIGRVMRYEPFCPQIRESPIPTGDVPKALARYEEARRRAQAELDVLEARLRNTDKDKMDE